MTQRLLFFSSALLLTLAFACPTALAADLDVLLVGNSYTSANDLAGVLEGLLAAADDAPTVRTEAYAPGGRRFPDHLAEADGTNGDTQLRQWFVSDVDGWNAIVFQDQSQVPGFYDLDPIYDASLNAFVGLDALAQAAPGAPATVLFMTWGRHSGDAQNAALYPDYAAMQSRLEEGYRRYAAAVDAPRVVYIAPVGLAFQAIHDTILNDGGEPTDPDTCFSRLYSPDGSHPSADGTWVAGATIAATLTGVVPAAPAGDCGEGWAAAVTEAVAAEGAPVLGDDDDDDSAEQADDDDDSAEQADDDDSSVNLTCDDDECASCGGCQATPGSVAGVSCLLLVPLLLVGRRRRAIGPAVAPVALLALTVVQAGCQADCSVDADTAADYAEPESWLCHPDLGRDECTASLDTVEVTTANRVEAFERSFAIDPTFDCFYVYPTVDLRLKPQLHDDLSDDEDEARAVRAQAARLAEVCRVWAPRYRQVTLGTYIGREDAVQPCFDVAWDDVNRAFDAWLEAVEPDRGVLLVGHSQGGQLVSRLLRERFDADAGLRDRLVGAMPIGWSVGVAAGELVGGSSEHVPICTTDDQAGCIVAYRSYAQGNQAPDASGSRAEGDQEVCVHPGDVGDGGPARLAGAVFRLGEGRIVELPEELDVGDAEYVVYRDYFEATCVDGEAPGLEVRPAPGGGDERANPVPFDGSGLSGSGGTHVLDVQLAMLDLVARAGTMGEAWAAR
jgi:hypothetical protein